MNKCIEDIKHEMAKRMIREDITGIPQDDWYEWEEYLSDEEFDAALRLSLELARSENG
jgi:hypothetical protein